VAVKVAPDGKSVGATFELVGPDDTSTSATAKAMIRIVDGQADRAPGDT
jgi:hypothetical protein